MMPVEGFGRFSLLDLDRELLNFAIGEMEKSGLPPIEFFESMVGVWGSCDDYVESLRVASGMEDKEFLEEASRTLGLPMGVIKKFDENRGIIERAVKERLEEWEKKRKFYLKALEEPEFALERLWLKIESYDLNNGLYALGDGFYARKHSIDGYSRLLIYKHKDFKLFKKGGDELTAVIDPHRRVIVTDSYDEIREVFEGLGVSSLELSRFLVSSKEYMVSPKDTYVKVDGKLVSLDTIIESDEENDLFEEIRKRFKKYRGKELMDYLLLRYELREAFRDAERKKKSWWERFKDYVKGIKKSSLFPLLVEGIVPVCGYLAGKLYQTSGCNSFNKVKCLKQDDEEVGILANDIDWKLNGQRIAGELEFAKIRYLRVNSSADFSKISNSSNLLILGGHLAYGISNVTSNILNPTEKYLLINNPGKAFVFVKKDVFKQGQTVVIVAGKTRRETSFGTLDMDSNYTPDGLQPLIDKDKDGLPVSFDPNDEVRDLERKGDIGKVRSYVVFAEGKGKGFDVIRDNLAWLFYNCSFTGKLFDSFGSEDYPDAALYILLDVVRKAIPSYVNDYGNMAIALSVVWDYPVKKDDELKVYPSKVDYDKYLADLANFFVNINEKKETKFNLKKLKVRELVNVVDTFFPAYRSLYVEPNHVKSIIVTPIGDLKALHEMYKGMLHVSVYSILNFAYRKVIYSGGPITEWPYPTPLQIDNMKVSCLPACFYVNTIGQVLGIPTRAAIDWAITHGITPYWDGNKWMYAIGYWRLKNPIPESELYTHDWNDGYHWEKYKVYIVEFDPVAFWWFKKLKK